MTALFTPNIFCLKQVPAGKYVQFRVTGFGHGDESLDSDISKVEMVTKFISDPGANANGSPYDLKREACSALHMDLKTNKSSFG